MALGKHLLQEAGFSADDKRLFSLLLLPSGIGALVEVLVLAGIVVWIFMSTRLQGGALERQLNDWRTPGDDFVLSPQVTSTISGVFNNIMVFVFWALLGAVLYLLVAGIIKAFNSTKEVIDEEHYVNNHGLVRHELLRFVFRLAILTLFIALTKLFLGIIVPFVFTELYGVVLQPTMLSDVVYGVLPAIMLWASLHAYVVLVRLLFLRPRLFLPNDYL